MSSFITEQDADSWEPPDIQRYVKIAASEVTVTVRLLIGGWEGLAFWFRAQEKKHTLQKKWVCRYLQEECNISPEARSKIMIPLVWQGLTGKEPLQQKHRYLLCSLTSPMKHLIVKLKQSMVSNLVFNIYLGDLTSQGGQYCKQPPLLLSDWGITLEWAVKTASCLHLPAGNALAVAKCKHWCTFTHLDCF